MDSESLRCLVALVDEGTVLGAAAKLGLSRATLRRRLQELERSLGVRLVERHESATRVTVQGQTVAARARAVLVDLASLRAVARDATSGPEVGTIRVVAPDGLPPGPLAAMLQGACALHPDARVDLRFYPDPLSRLDDDADVFVHFGAAPARGAFVTRVIARVPERLLATREYLRAHGEPTSVGDLSRHRLLSWTPPGEDAGVWPLAGGTSFPAGPVVASPDAHLVRLLVRGGMGLGRLPEAGFPDDGFEGELVSVLPGFFSREFPLRVLVPEAQARTPRMRVVVAALEGMGSGTGR